MKKLFSQEEYDECKSRERLPLECYQCGETFYSQKSKGPLALKYNHLRAKARLLVKTSLPEELLKCSVCGYSRKIHTAHIIGLGQMPDTTLVSEANSPDNLSPLCAIHHSEFDDGVLSREDIKSVTELLEKIES